MSDAKATVAIARGYARDEKDEKRLRAAGVRTIYRADKGEGLGKFKMRSGEVLGVVDGLLAFGSLRSQMRDAVATIHKQGAVIVDVETGERSDRDGVAMLDAALVKYRPTSAKAREMQRASTEAQTEGRMPKSMAKRIWLNPKFAELGNRDVIEMMPGWTWRSAYHHFGPRNVRSGPKPK